MNKVYRLRVSFGDGCPIDDLVTAANGVQAQDLALRRNPGARNIHLIGIEGETRNQAVAPAVSLKEYNYFQETDRETQVECCLRMRSEGKSHSAIAGFLGVSKSTIGRWIKQYG